MNRRGFIKGLLAGAVAAVLPACRRPEPERWFSGDGMQFTDNETGEVTYAPPSDRDSWRPMRTSDLKSGVIGRYEGMRFIEIPGPQKRIRRVSLSVNNDQAVNVWNAEPWDAFDFGHDEGTAYALVRYRADEGVRIESIRAERVRMPR